jgi:hypothetical protein
MKAKLIIVAGLIGLCTISLPAQDLLNKMKKKAGDGLVNKLGTKPGANTGTTSNPNTNSNPSGSSEPNSSSPANKGGGGLTSTPPDVNQNLADAGSSYSSGKYGEARYAVQQAMLGVELEIGNKILKSLPATVSGLKTKPEQDQVTSTGYGWAGLTIQRVYSDEKDKQLKLIVANNGAWMSALNMYLSSGGYAQTTGGQQNWKQTKVKGYRSIIEYSEGSGYKLSVPMGQSSLVVLEGVNFATEQEMMTAGNAIDYDGIKKMLGEQ